MLHARICTVIVALCVAGLATAADPEGGWKHRGGDPIDTDSMPDSRLRRGLLGLPPAAKTRALARLQQLHFPAKDLELMGVDADGNGIHIFCPIDAVLTPAPAQVQAAPVAEAIIVPIASQPIYHSKPGATRIIFLDFNGHVVSGSNWLAGATLDALPFDLDGDATTFSDAEQLAIQRVWQRVAEDYAPYNVDVTTESPATWTSTVCRCLITTDTDRNGVAMPSQGKGGVAYLNVFGGFAYNANQNATYSPAFVYYSNLGGGREDFIAEAASHEVGHNMGLSHDATGSQSYYGGHGGTTSLTSWGPIMGTGYNQQVSQWSKGEYSGANNTQDDLSIIAGKLTYRSDDYGNSPSAATMLTAAGGTALSATGIISQTSDVDAVAFAAGAGNVTITVSPFVSPANTRGGNLDVSLTLLDSAGSTVATATPTGATAATITTTLAGGGYVLLIGNAGEPTPPATGYTTYGSLGQWTLTGTVAAWTGGDAFPPAVASWTAADVAAAGATQHTVTVTYADNVAISVASLNTGDLLVTGPGAFSQSAAYVSVNPTGDGTPRTATYRITPPGGAWDAADNGTYNLWIQAGQVADSGGSMVPAQLLGSFHVAIGATVDVASPTAVATVPTATLMGATAYDITVTYSDNTAVDTASLDGADIQVTGPAGFSQLAAFVSVDNAANGTPRTATYRLTPPGGSWDPADNGAYTFTLRAGQVRDVAGNYASSANLGTLNASIAYANGPGAGLPWERWDGIAGTSVSNLTGAAAYAGPPSATGQISSGNITLQPNLDNFGARLTGVFIAPVSGTYYFDIASDDSSELWLSPDSDPAHAVLSASVSGYTGLDQWNKYGTQRSAAKTLVGGGRYAITVLLKEGSGGDFVQVGVEMPGGVSELPAPYHRFDPVSSNQAPTIDPPADTSNTTLVLP